MGSPNLVAQSEVARLRHDLERLRAENVRLARLLELRGQNTAPAPEQLSAGVAAPGLVTRLSPLADKLALFADRFRARSDVYAMRWENGRKGTSGCPLLRDNTCWFLAADFDGPAAMLDALAYCKAARADGVPAALEISQSGRGAHVPVAGRPTSKPAANGAATFLRAGTAARRPQPSPAPAPTAKPRR